MTPELRKDLRFYSCLLIASGLLATSLFLPPVGIIAESVLYSAIILLGTGALIEGVDIKGIIQEVRLLKEFEFNNKTNKTE